MKNYSLNVETWNEKKLIRKAKQITNILKAKHRNGLNYLVLLDTRKAIADRLFDISFTRVFYSN